MNIVGRFLRGVKRVVGTAASSTWELGSGAIRRAKNSLKVQYSPSLSSRFAEVAEQSKESISPEHIQLKDEDDYYELQQLVQSYTQEGKPLPSFKIKISRELMENVPDLAHREEVLDMQSMQSENRHLMELLSESGVEIDVNIGTVKNYETVKIPDWITNVEAYDIQGKIDLCGSKLKNFSTQRIATTSLQGDSSTSIDYFSAKKFFDLDFKNPSRYAIDLSAFGNIKSIKISDFEEYGIKYPKSLEKLELGFDPRPGTKDLSYLKNLKELKLANLSSQLILNEKLESLSVGYLESKIDTSKCTELKELKIDYMTTKSHIIAGPVTESIEFGNTSGILDLTQAKQLQRLINKGRISAFRFDRVEGDLNTDIMKGFDELSFYEIRGNVRVGPSIKTVELNTAMGAIDFNNAIDLRKLHVPHPKAITGLEKAIQLEDVSLGSVDSDIDLRNGNKLKYLRILDIAEGVQIDLPEMIESIELGRIPKGLNLEKATHLKDVSLGSVDSDIDLRNTNNLKSLRILDIAEGVRIDLPETIESMELDRIPKGLNLETLNKLKSIKIEKALVSEDLALPEKLENLTIKALEGRLDLRQFDKLESITCDTIRDNSVLLLGPSIKEVEINSVFGKLDLSAVKELRDLSMMQLGGSGTLQGTNSIEKLTIDYIDDTTLDLKDFKNLKEFTCRRGNPNSRLIVGPKTDSLTLDEFQGTVDLSEAKDLKKLRLQGLRLQPQFIEASSIEELEIDSVYSNSMDVGIFKNLKKLTIGKSHTTSILKIGPELEELNLNGYQGEIDLSSATGLKRFSANPPLSEKYEGEIQEVIFWNKHAGSIERNDIKAVEKLAKDGDLEAMLFLGRRYYYGINTNIDLKKAINYCTQGAEKGNADCMYLLGEMYFTGIGMDKNIDTAYTLYSKAFQSGSTKAGDKLNIPQLFEHVTIGIITGDNKGRIDMKKLIHDPEMKQWNTIKLRSSVSDNDWEKLKTALKTMVDSIYPGAKENYPGLTTGWKTDNIYGFFDNSMNSSDATSSPKGKEGVRKRVASIVDYLNKLDLKNEKELELAKGLMDILDIGGHACPDRVMVGLDNAESYIRMHQKEGNYVVNVMVNDFKKNLIEARLIDPNYNESIESYFYFMVKFNKILGLGMNKTTMIFEECAQKKPLFEALRRVANAIDEENLIGYISGRKEFRAMFGEEEKQMIKDAQQQIEDLYTLNEEGKISDDDLDTQELELLAKIKRVKENFYTDKARELLEQKGYLVAYE